MAGAVSAVGFIQLRSGVLTLLLLGFWGCSPPAPLTKNIPAAATPTTSVAQPNAQPTAESQTENVPPEVASLARQVVQGKVGDREKALALYDWIAKNVRYDINAYLSGNLPDPSPEVVLDNRQAVCEGYARLFLAMASEVGLEAVMVPGYSKGFAPTESKAEPDHAWNAVKLDGQWALLDPTWGAGHIDESKTFVAEFSRDWFAVPPEEFATSHLASQPQWQLLPTPIDAETFWKRPSLSPLYFDYELSLDSHPQGQITADGPLQLEISSGQDCRLMAGLYDGPNQLPETHTFVERQGSNFTVQVLPPRPGQYRLVVFAGAPNELSAESAVVYEVTATGQADRVFPKTMKAFSDEEVRLVSPRSGLRRGQITELVVEAPRASKLMAVIGQQQLDFQQENGRFVVQLTPTGDKVTVFGSYNDSPKYDGLLEFPVSP